MNLRPSATDISSLITSASGTSTMEPLVSGGVGTNTLSSDSRVLSYTSSFRMLVTNPMEWSPGRGNCTSTTCLKVAALPETNAPLICLRVR